MGKQMEGDNRERRKRANEAKKAGDRPSEWQATTGASKQRHHEPGSGDSDEKLESTQRGESKRGGDDVPRPLRGKGRQSEPRVPPGP